MLTTVSVPKKSANTFEDLEQPKIATFQDGTAAHFADENGTNRGVSNVVSLADYRERQQTGVFEEEEAESTASGSLKTGDLSPIVFQDSYTSRQEQKQPPSSEFIHITRAIFVKSILQALDRIQAFAQTSDAISYAHQILYQIQEFETTSPDDPFLEILSGLYVALAYENLWADYDAGQFAVVRRILKNFADRPVLKPMDIEKAIMAMEAAGFNTTPIPIFTEASNE